MCVLFLTSLLLLGFHFSSIECKKEESQEKATAGSTDPFIESEVMSNGKIFLHPWNYNERQGDWLFNKGFCRKHSAQMVQIQNMEENVHFHNFIKDVLIVHPGAWLGSKVHDASATVFWEDSNKTANFTNWQPGEPNEKGVTCLHVAWNTDARNGWWNYHCNLKTMYIVCERYVGKQQSDQSSRTNDTHNIMTVTTTITLPPNNHQENTNTQSKVTATSVAV